MLGVREVENGKAGTYVWQTYQKVYESVLHIGSAMRHLGVNPTARCGIYGSNCPEWFMAMEACNGHSVVCVPLYDTLGITHLFLTWVLSFWTSITCGFKEEEITLH
jgi:long-chain acyl-CoA synthetase